MGRSRRAPHARGRRGHRRAVPARRARAARPLETRPRAQAARLRPGDRAAEHLEIGAGAVLRRHSARLAESPGIEAKQPLPATRLRVEAAEIAAVARRFGIESRYAVLCPGAEYGPAKRWPYFAQLAQRLAMPVVLLGSANDAAAAAGIGGTNLIGKTTLDEAIHLIAGAAFV